MKENREELYIHNIDLHYHAGQERAEDLNLEDYIDHAQLTGRKIVGLTDHLGLYLDEREGDFPYKQDITGLKQYYEDINKIQDRFSDITLKFAPEISHRYDLEKLPLGEINEIADYYIFELPYLKKDISKNTQAILKRLEQIKNFMLKTNQKGFVAHPFRSAVNFRLIKQRIEPWILDIPLKNDYSFTISELNDFFVINIEAFARKACELKIPVEINGNTQYRIRGSNLPATMEMLWKSFAVFRDNGVELLPGSDQHGFMTGVGRIGGYVPADCFRFLELEVEDLDFIRNI